MFGGGGLYLFSIGDIPVRVSIWYGLLLLYYFQGADTRSNLLWAAVVTISILFHELGHALVARHYRLRPQILLHGLGGLCSHDRAERALHDFFIIAMGPGAGLLLGGTTYLFAVLAPDLVASADHLWISEVVTYSLWINLTWSVVNLLPLWPLDGGQLFRLGMLRLAKPMLAERITHIVALALLGIAALIALTMQSGLLVVLALWIGWANVSALRAGRATGPIRSQNKFAKTLLERAKQAYVAGEFGEAARICHQIRKEPQLSERLMHDVWKILGVSEARIGEHDSALSYLNRARTTADVVEGRIECLYALGRDAELEQLLASNEFKLISATRRRQILDVVRSGS